MTRFAKAVLVCICVVVSPALAAAQTIDEKQEILERLKAAVIERDTKVNELQTKLSQLQQRNQSSYVSDKLLKAREQTLLVYEVALRAHYHSNIKLLEQQQAGFDWQRRAANWILVLVILVTTSGILFSGFELYSAATLPFSVRQAKNSEGKEVPTAGNTEIEISLNSLKITTAVIGLVVLIISMAFLYLFLDKVYGIEVIDVTAGSQQPGTRPPK